MSYVIHLLSFDGSWLCCSKCKNSSDGKVLRTIHSSLSYVGLTLLVSALNNDFVSSKCIFAADKQNWI